jgi:hypothetical protein
VDLIAADLDDDGRLDLAMSGSYEVGILLHGRVDRTSPGLSCPGDLSVACSGPAGALVDFTVAAHDDCDPRPLVACDYPPGTTFPPGTTVVTCTARDAAGNRSRCTFEVTVACARQVPGDCDLTGDRNISDPVCLLRHLFSGETALPCGDRTSADPANVALLDWNGDGRLDISDGVAGLRWLFLGGPQHVLGRECRPVEGCPQGCS